MKKLLGWGWLGFTMSRFTDIGIFDWELYVVAFPTIFLVMWDEKIK